MSAENIDRFMSTDIFIYLQYNFSRVNKDVYVYWCAYVIQWVYILGIVEIHFPCRKVFAFFLRNNIIFKGFLFF